MNKALFCDTYCQYIDIFIKNRYARMDRERRGLLWQMAFQPLRTALFCDLATLLFCDLAWWTRRCSVTWLDESACPNPVIELFSKRGDHVDEVRMMGWMCIIYDRCRNGIESKYIHHSQAAVDNWRYPHWVGLGFTTGLIPAGSCSIVHHDSLDTEDPIALYVAQSLTTM